jgi:hypothetical protein
LKKYVEEYKLKFSKTKTRRDFLSNLKEKRKSFLYYCRKYEIPFSEMSDREYKKALINYKKRVL